VILVTKTLIDAHINVFISEGCGVYFAPQKNTCFDQRVGNILLGRKVKR
jgi:hypothetical protein